MKLICHTSKLRADDGRLRRKPFGARMCIECVLASFGRREAHGHGVPSAGCE